MMNGSLPDSASSPIASGAAFDPGALLGAKSGTSYPVHFVPSHQIHFFRSLHGLPWTSAEARLYRMRRFGGPGQPPCRWAPAGVGAAGRFPAAGFRSRGWEQPAEDPHPDWGRRKKADFPSSVRAFGLPPRDPGAVLPERRRLGEPVVLDHQPLEPGESLALDARVERGGWVLADAQHALHAPLIHGHEHRQ